MLSVKSHIEPWTIPIDSEKRQNFCLSYSDCPGWEIEPIGTTEKVQ